MMKHLVLLLLATLSLGLWAQEVRLDRIEPPNWWTGFSNPGLQLLVYGKNIAETEVSLNYPGFTIKKIDTTDNPNYLFLDMTIAPETKSGMAEIQFRIKNKIVARYAYQLKDRDEGSALRQSFTPADVIYLLMPDRFSNGDTTNDNIAGMVQNTNRADPDGRHGGDIKGIADHLDYLKELGVTALWINPLLENNQTKYSYHGYSITDFYTIDPRFGNNDDYGKLSGAIHQRGMKLIMDMVFNHCGSGHWWMNDLPSPDWINTWPEFTRSNYRAGSVSDPYVSTIDSNLFVRGWFDYTMPDLNQHNPFLKNYLIQNSIWWIEFAHLDGIRQDTHPYPFKDMMSEWGKRISEEYPNFNIVGECWMNYPASVAYWQKNALNRDGYNSNLPSVFDFPLYDAMTRAFNEPEGWNTGILRLYEILAQDNSYPNPDNIVTFADNHDVNRCLDSQNNDIKKLKMALAFILTTRGIPQIFYGTEILLTTGADKGHGTIRQDFPGGWPGDSLNAFAMKGRNEMEKEMYQYLNTLLQWRKTNKAIHTGQLKHFIPSDGIYTYFRFHSEEVVMVIMNNNDETKTIETKRYSEFLKNFKTGKDILGGSEIGDLSLLTLPSKTTMIIELKR